MKVARLSWLVAVLLTAVAGDGAGNVGTPLSNSKQVVSISLRCNWVTWALLHDNF